MPRKPKRPDGAVIEEFVTSTWHVFENSVLIFHDNDPVDGDYTGRFRFRFSGGKMTPWYRIGTAPQWLEILYLESTHD